MNQVHVRRGDEARKEGRVVVTHFLETIIRATFYVSSSLSVINTYAHVHDLEKSTTTKNNTYFLSVVNAHISLGFHT